MKSWIRLLAVVSMFGLYSNANAGVTFSLLGGGRMSSLSTDPDTSIFSSAIGFQGGMYLGVMFNPYLGLRTGAVYSIKQVDGTIAALTFATKLTYVDIPANLVLRIGMSPFYLFGGVKYGVKLSSSTETGSGTAVDGIDVGANNLMANGGLGLAFGVGGGMTMGFEGEYEMGMSDLDNDGSTATSAKLSGIVVNLVFTWGGAGK